MILRESLIAGRKPVSASAGLEAEYQEFMTNRCDIL